MTTISQVIRITDTSGSPITGAALTVAGTALTGSGASNTVNGTNLGTGAALTGVTLKYYDFADGTGQYSLLYDPASAEAHFAVTASKSGVTLNNPVFGVNFFADPSTVALTNAQTTATNQQANVTAGLTTQGLTAARAAKLDNADVATSTRSTFAGGAVASVTAPVTVGTNNDKTGYTASASNLPTDYQQRGAAVTLPTTPPSGYGGTATDLSGVPAAVWGYGTKTITGGTVTTYTGNTPQTGDAYARLGAPAGASLAADVAANGAAIAGIAGATVTALESDSQWQKLFAFEVGKYTVSGNIVTFYAADDTTPLFSLTLTKDGSGNVTARTHN